MHRFKMAAAAILIASTAMTQQPPAPALPTFSETVEVRVLNLDVDVTDGKGNPITDLKREDFTLKIGGKVVPIDYFSTVNDGTIHAPDLASRVRSVAHCDGLPLTVEAVEEGITQREGSA